MGTPKLDSEASIREARQKGFTVERILRDNGVSPAKNGQWKAFECPFCHRNKAYLFMHDGVQLFKCMVNPCPSENKAMAESQLMAQILGVSAREGFVEFLKAAGVWKEFSKKVKQAAGPASVPLDPKVKAKPADDAATPALPLPALPNPVLPETVIVPPKPDDLLKLLGDPDPSVFLSVTEKILSLGQPALDWLRPALLREVVTPEDLARRQHINELIQKLTPVPGAVAPANPVKAPVEPAPPKPEDPRKLPGYGTGRLALREFYEMLGWLEADEKKVFDKRRLESRTSMALGYRSNLKTNEDIIRHLMDKYGFRELLASGLWLPRDPSKHKEPRPNNQYFGFGQSGRKPEAQRKDKADKFIWSFCNPIFIPYFTDLGELVALRPHKGGAPGGTAAGHSAHVYIPRDVDALSDEKYEEIFETVVVTEGEFKAAALWQVVGAGRTDGGEAFGVAAVPGITFANNFMMREELDNWLRAVRCRRVIVAYDHEVKDDPKLPTFQPDVRKRFDAQIWARFLATDLHQKLHIFGEVCILPREWMTDGKADWDGALVKLVGQVT